MNDPEQCRSMAEVREGVDMVDGQIVALLAKRFRFMISAARIKPSRDEVRDEERKAAVLDHVRGQAQREGAPAGLIVDIYESLVEASIGFELEQFDKRSAVGAKLD